MIMVRTPHRIFLLLLLVVLSVNVSARIKKGNLSDSSKISLITCSSGNELYSIFGHSAIRVADPQKKLDIVFNYGTFSFEQPNFYPNFVRGHLKYILSAYLFKDFYKEYVNEKRWVWEQVLNISLSERQLLFDSLIINYRPENRSYRYDFFNDNCATRIRDMFVKGIPRKIGFDYSSFEQGQSFRQLLMPNLNNSPWAKLGINLLLGFPADRVAPSWDYMYLPEHLKAAFENASFSSDSAKQPFAFQPKVLLKGEASSDTFIWGSPLQLFLVVLLIAIYLSFRDIRRGVKNLWFDRTLLILAGFLGVLFTFLWVGTAHKSMVWNLNLLWANPFHLLVAFFLSIKKPRQWVKTYLSVNLIILLALLITWLFLPQALPWAIYPLVLALALRMAVIARQPF